MTWWYFQKTTCIYIKLINRDRSTVRKMLWLYQRMSEWVYIYMFTRYLSVIIFTIPCLNRLKNDIESHWPRRSQIREPYLRLEGSCQVGDIRGLGKGQGEWRVRVREETLEENRLSRRGRNMTWRFEPKCLKRYSSEERTEFWEGVMKTLYLNVMVLGLLSWCSG